jgi:hypothetical protein
MVGQRCLALVLGCAVLGGSAVFYFARQPRGEELPPPPGVALPKGKGSELLLAETEREFLWDCEHHGLVLGKYGLKALAEALRKADRAALERLLAPGFVGHALSRPRRVGVDKGYLKVFRDEDSGAPAEKLTADQFVSRLLELRKTFHVEPKAKSYGPSGVAVSLKLLAPERREAPDGPWKGSCVVRLWGEARPEQPAEVVFTLDFTMAPPSKEGLPKGAWLYAARITQSTVGQATHWLLQDVAAKRGLAPERIFDQWKEPEPLRLWGGAYVVDFNRDGILDLAVSCPKNGLFLYQGLPDGSFRDVTEDLGVPRYPRDHNGQPAAPIIAFVDLDGDGWEDLIHGCQIYRNERGKRFRDVTQQSNLRIPPDLIGLAIADYDRDGRLDLYGFRAGGMKQDSWIGGKRGDGKENILWRNLGNWQFEDVTKKAGVGGGQRSTFTALWLDINNDGWPDLYVPNEFGPGILYVNRGDGTFRPKAIDGPGDFGTMGATCGDVNNDGRVDLYAANMYSKAGSRIMNGLLSCKHPYDPKVLHTMRQFVAGSQLYLNRGQKGLEPVGKQFDLRGVGWAYGPALFDLDNDGYLDLYATAGYRSQDRNKPDG